MRQFAANDSLHSATGVRAGMFPSGPPLPQKAINSTTRRPNRGRTTKSERKFIPRARREWPPWQEVSLVQNIGVEAGAIAPNSMKMRLPRRRLRWGPSPVRQDNVFVPASVGAQISRSNVVRLSMVFSKRIEDERLVSFP